MSVTFFILCEHLHLQHLSIHDDNFFSLCLTLVEKKKLLCTDDYMGCVGLHVCVCVIVVYFSYFETLHRIHSRWKFSQIEKPHTAPKWEMRRWFWHIFSCHDGYSSCMYRFNDDVLFFTFFSCSIHSSSSWFRVRCTSRENLFFFLLSIFLFLFCLFPMNWTNKMYRRIIDHQFYGLYSLFFLLVRWYCCCLQFIFLFFFDSVCVWVLIFRLPSIISGIN